MSAQKKKEIFVTELTKTSDADEFVNNCTRAARTLVNQIIAKGDSHPMCDAQFLIAAKRHPGTAGELSNIEEFQAVERIRFVVPKTIEDLQVENIRLQKEIEILRKAHGDAAAASDKKRFSK